MYGCSGNAQTVRGVLELWLGVLEICMDVLELWLGVLEICVGNRELWLGVLENVCRCTGNMCG